MYESQQDVALFQSTWIREVVQSNCTIHDLALGQHLLLPHYLAPRTDAGGSPQPTLPHVESGMCLVDAHSTWENSRESNDRDRNKPCLSKDQVVARRPATQPGGVYSLSENASAMFAEYNAMWDELESRVRDTDMKGKRFLVHISHSSDFVCIWHGVTITIRYEIYTYMYMPVDGK